MIDAIPEDLVLDYSRGYADLSDYEFSDPADWRGRHVHIPGGSPPKQLKAIRQLDRRRCAHRTGDPRGTAYSIHPGAHSTIRFRKAV